MDKRALRQIAIQELEAEALTATVDFKKAEIQKEAPSLRSEFYTQALYEGKLLEEIMPALATPPPVYQQNVQVIVNEKLDSSKEVSTTTSNSSDSDFTADKLPGNLWDGYENDTLPRKTHGRVVRNLRHQIFSLYRRLFGVVFVVNMAILIAIFVKGGTNAQELGLIVVANLFCAILMRQDYVINVFFTICCAVPSS